MPCYRYRFTAGDEYRIRTALDEHLAYIKQQTPADDFTFDGAVIAALTNAAVRSIGCTVHDLRDSELAWIAAEIERRRELHDPHLGITERGTTEAMTDTDASIQPTLEGDVVPPEAPEPPSGPFHLFAGSYYYPTPHLGDYVGVFPTIDACKDHLLTDGDHHDWWLIAAIGPDGRLIEVDQH